MGIATLHRLDELIHNMLRRWLVRIAHPEINNILTASSRRRFQLTDDVENVRGQAVYALKIVVHDVKTPRNLPAEKRAKRKVVAQLWRNQSSPRMAAKSAAGL